MLARSGHGTPAYILRHYSMRRFNLYLDAENRRLHTERQERWDHARLQFAAQTGKTLDEYPPYESEDDYDPEAIEAALSASSVVIRVPPTQAE